MAGIVYAPWRIATTSPTNFHTQDRRTSWLYKYAYDRIEELLLSNGFLQTSTEHIWKDPIKELEIKIGSSNGGREWATTLSTAQGKTYFVSNDPSPLLEIINGSPKFFGIR